MAKSFKYAQRRFWTNTRGNVSTLFAMSMTVLLTSIGASIDYGRVLHQRSIANGITDAAVIAAVAAAVDADKAEKEGVVEIAKQAGLDAWDANAKATKFDVEGYPEIEVTPGDDPHEWNATVTFNEDYSTHFMSLFGQEMFPIHSFSEASSSFAEVKEFWDVHIAVDISASMGIGATQQAINSMTADPQMMSCSFACHYSNGPGLSDTMAVARAKGYPIRIDVVKSAINQVTTKLEGITSGDNISMVLHGFSTSLSTLVNKTTDLSQVRNYAINLGLTPGSVGNTNFRIAMNTLTPLVGNSGDATTAAKAKKAAIIITDGIHDHNINEINVVTNLGQHYKLGPIAPSFCQSMKDNGVKVGVLYVPYITPPGYGGYTNAYIAQVPTKLQQCASPDMYFEATQSSQIEGMLTTLINKAFGSDSELRLTQ